MVTSYVKQFCCLLKEKYNEGSEILLLSVGKPRGGKMYGVLGWINLWMSKWSCLYEQYIPKVVLQLVEMDRHSFYNPESSVCFLNAVVRFRMG